ncbi:MAG: ABC transporter permease [Myxococcales bacterium]|nr:ABC transporter permease [Myxococcales bacterium]
MGQLILIATQNLLQHKRRNLLLGIAIALVTAMLITLLGLSAGIETTMLRSATTLSSGHINVAGFYKVTSGSAAPLVTGHKELERLVRENTPHLDYTISRMRGWGKVISDTTSFQAGINGVDIDTERGLKNVLRLAPQKDYKPGGTEEIRGNLDNLREPNTVMLFVEQAKRLEVDVGDQLTISAPTPRGVSNTLSVSVVAIAKDVGFMSGWGIFVPNQTVRDIYQLTEDTTGAIMVYLDDIAKLEEVENHLRQLVAKAGHRLMEKDSNPFWMKFERVGNEDWIGQKIDITNWEDEISFMSWTIQSFDALTGILVMILMILVAVGIMNTLWIAIRERTREIGTMRAIGAQKGMISKMFLLEAAVLGFASTAIGALAAVLIAYSINTSGVVIPSEAFQLFTMSETLHVLVRPQTVVFSVGLLTMFTTLSALYPAYRAAKLKPITAIHHVG